MLWSSVREFTGQSECFNHRHRNLLASISQSQLSHKEHAEWQCHKITELEIVVPHSAVLRKCYLFILGPLLESISKIMQQTSGGVMFLNGFHSTVHSSNEFLWRFYSSQLITCYMDRRSTVSHTRLHITEKENKHGWIITWREAILPKVIGFQRNPLTPSPKAPHGFLI